MKATGWILALLGFILTIGCAGTQNKNENQLEAELQALEKEVINVIDVDMPETVDLLESVIYEIFPCDKYKTESKYEIEFPYGEHSLSISLYSHSPEEIPDPDDEIIVTITEYGMYETIFKYEENDIIVSKALSNDPDKQICTITETRKINKFLLDVFKYLAGEKNFVHESSFITDTDFTDLLVESIYENIAIDSNISYSDPTLVKSYEKKFSYTNDSLTVSLINWCLDGKTDLGNDIIFRIKRYSLYEMDFTYTNGYLNCVTKALRDSSSLQISYEIEGVENINLYLSTIYKILTGTDNFGYREFSEIEKV